MAKYHEYIREAVQKGCWFDFQTNEFVSHTGLRKSPKLYGGQRYPSTAILRRKSFPLHKFVAYLLYGEESFSKDLQVRHLDGNTLNLSKENIVLGTSSENQMDKLGEARKLAASKARKSQGRPTNSRLTEQDIVYIRNKYKDLKLIYPKKLPNGCLKSMADDFNVSTSCIESVINNKNWKDVDVKG